MRTTPHETPRRPPLRRVRRVVPDVPDLRQVEFPFRGNPCLRMRQINDPSSPRAIDARRGRCKLTGGEPFAHVRFAQSRKDQKPGRLKRV